MDRAPDFMSYRCPFTGTSARYVAFSSGESYLELGPGLVLGGCTVGSAVPECTNCETTWDDDGRRLAGDDGRRL